MTDLATHARRLEVENQRLRDQLTAEHDARRRWQGALNRAEDLIKRAKDKEEKGRDDVTGAMGRYAYNIAIEAYTVALDYIDTARQEAAKK